MSFLNAFYQDDNSNLSLNYYFGVLQTYQSKIAILFVSILSCFCLVLLIFSIFFLLLFSQYNFLLNYKIYVHSMKLKASLKNFNSISLFLCFILPN